MDRVQFYRHKAEETRTLAERMTLQTARETMLDVAATWERLADQEERLRSLRFASDDQGLGSSA